MKILIQIFVLGCLFSPKALGASQALYKGEARFFVKAEHVDAFKNAVAKIIGPTRKEPGNISYEAFQVVKEGELTNQFEFHEIWKSEQALKVDHLEKTLHMKEFFETVRIGSPDSMVDSFEVNGHEVVDLQPEGP